MRRVRELSWSSLLAVSWALAACSASASVRSVESSVTSSVNGSKEAQNLIDIADLQRESSGTSLSAEIPFAHVEWCASGGASIVGSPVLDEEERSYIATSDGYLHAFERDGRFRWSYTVKGTPLGSVSLRPHDGVILMGTSQRYVYAINQAGGLYWFFRTLTPVWSGLFALNEDSIVFLGHDRRLYALANRSGRARYRVRAPGDLMGDPVVAAGNVVWLPLSDGVARLQAAIKMEKFNFSSATEQLVAFGDRAIARAGGETYILQEGGPMTSRGAAAFLAADNQHFALFDEAGKARLFTHDLVSVNLPKETSTDQRKYLSDAPAMAHSHFWLPYADGTIGVRPLLGGREERLKIGNGPLATPVVGSSGKWALVPTRGGRFCALVVDR